MRGSAFSGVTLLDLATHRSGLPAWRPLYLHASDRLGYVAQIARELPAVPAGETLYSDLGYILLGMVIEQASGQSLDRLFHERIARPLGDPRIGFAAGDSIDAAATERGNAYERRMAGADGEGHPWRDARPSRSGPRRQRLGPGRGRRARWPVRDYRGGGDRRTGIAPAHRAAARRGRTGKSASVAAGRPGAHCRNGRCRSTRAPREESFPRWHRATPDSPALRCGSTPRRDGFSCY